MPFWAGLSAAGFSLLLGFSFWFLLKVSLPNDTLKGAVDVLKEALGGVPATLAAEVA